MAGQRGRAGEDLRVSKEGGSKSMRPGLLQALFKGGPAKVTGADDFREGRGAFKPRTTQALFRGGPAKLTGGDDARMGHGHYLPGAEQMLADGGELEEQGDGAPEVSDDLKVAASEVMEALKSGDPEHFAMALKAAVDLCQSEGGEEPHEGEGEDDDEGGPPPFGR